MAQAISSESRPRTLHGEITRRVREIGLGQSRDRMFYIWSTIHVALFATVFVLAINTTSMWLIGLLAIPAGFLSTQIALLVHDVLHGQAPRRHRWLQKPMSFFLGNILVGLSDDWWKPKHDAHHANPNHTEKDPDIQSIFFAVDISQLKRKGRAERFFTRHQHWAFFCLIPLQAMSFRKASIVFLLTKKTGTSRVLGLTGIGLHLVWYGAFLFLLGIPEGIVFAAIHQMVFGIYNSLIFAPNHKGMPVVGPNERLDSFTSQVITARNVQGGWIFWYISGGLDLQIEHHLFPWMSRYNLHKAQPLVKRYCEEVGVPYASMGIFASYAQWIHHFYQVSREA